jgi:UDP-3-O-[3-hydroxymyristoyl] glucosamine N-acyltransferase
MKFTANQIAEILGGEIEGNGEVQVDKLSKIEEGMTGSLTFLSNPKYTQYIYSTNASVAIVNRDFIAEKEIETTLIKVEDAYKAFTTLLEYYNSFQNNKTGIEENVRIHESAKMGDQVYLGANTYISKNVVLGEGVKIYPNVFIGDDVRIGDHTIIYPGTIIYHDCFIGAHCVIHAGAIIGADGFGFAPSGNGDYDKVPQIGNVIIEDRVEIGAATTIDRATLGSTIIRKGVKLDNQIQVAHNVEIGEHTVIAAQSGIAGSTKIGKNCMVGGQVGFIGHITIGDNVRIQAQTGVARNVKDNETLYGTPAFAYKDYVKSYIYFKKLPELVATINQLKEEIKELKDKS